MPIPLPASLVGAGVLAPYPLAIGVNAPVKPPEGAKIVPFQLLFDTHAIWQVDLNTILNAQTLTQLRGMWIDATQSTDDVTVYFPDTGYTVTIQAGYGRFISTVNRQFSYVFYVSLANQATSTVDIVNIIATNFVIPTFTAYNPTPLFAHGLIDADIDIRQQSQQGGSMLYIPAQKNGGNVTQVYVGGYQLATDLVHYNFVIQLYDVTGFQPFLVAAYTSEDLSFTDPQDLSWQLSPDGTKIAFYIQDQGSGHNEPDYFVIFDTQAKAFGNVLHEILIESSVTKQVQWLTNNVFVIDEVSPVGGSGVRGLEIFHVSGTTITDGGFQGIWGAGSGATRQPLGYAQFMSRPQGGVYNMMSDVSGLSFSALFIRPLVWNGSSITVGNAYTLASGLSPGTGSGPHANFVTTGGLEGAFEYTLDYATVLGFALFSFIPLDTTAAIIRPYHTYTYDFGTGTTNFPIVFNNALALVERAAFDNFYRIQPVIMNGANFIVDESSLVPNITALTSYFNGLKIRGNAILFGGVGGFADDLGQFGVITL